ncbi:MAG: BspA family leucine-rich repeat surface protein, partial [Prevotella sp.]
MKINIRLLSAFLLCAFSSALAAQEKTSYVVFSGDSLTMTFYHDSQSDSRAADAANVYSLEVEEGSSLDSPWQTDLLIKTITKAVFDASFADARPTLTNGWFRNAEQLEQIEGIEYLNTSEVTSMRYMFCGCKRLKQIDLSHFNTSMCASFTSMFDGCESLVSIDASSFDTHKTTSWSMMFANCTSLKDVNLSSFYTFLGRYFSNMFVNCTSLNTLNIEQFRFRELCDISDMFNGCTGLTQLRLGSSNIEEPIFRTGTFKSVGTTEKPCSLLVRNDFNFEIFDEDNRS